MDWQEIINFLGKEIVIALIFCFTILLFLIGIYMACCYCSHRQRGRLRPAYKRKPHKSDYIPCVRVRDNESPLRRATAPPLVDGSLVNNTHGMSNSDCQDPELVSTSLIQPVIHSSNYKDINNVTQITESPPDDPGISRKKK